MKAGTMVTSATARSGGFVGVLTMPFVHMGYMGYMGYMVETVKNWDKGAAVAVRVISIVRT